MADDTSVWRYLSLDAVIETIKTRSLRLTRVDRFSDKFEGSVPKANMGDQDLLLSGAESRRRMMNSVAAHFPGMATTPPPDEDPWARITRLRRAWTRSAHASCWSTGDESEALWRLYCGDSNQKGVGVALRTTLARLAASVAAHDLYVSPIIYRRYHEGLAFTDEMDSLMHKRHGFRAEQELRLLKFDVAQYGALDPKNALVSDLPEHIYVDWVLGDVVDEIFVAPEADASYENSVRHAIHEADANLADRVALSVLNDRRYPPNF